MLFFWKRLQHSVVFQFHSCDSYTHKRVSCIGSPQEETNLNCKKCISSGAEVTNTTGQVQNSLLSCDFCDYSTKAKYNMQRHIDRKHGDAEKTGTPSRQENRKSEVTLDTLLKSIGLENYASNFHDEKVDLKLILDLSEDDMRRFYLGVVDLS